MAETTQLNVFRIYHSGVVTPWRERNTWLRRFGAKVTMVSPRRWNEGGADVKVERLPGEPLSVARTFGRHPYGFVYNPLPIWRQLRCQRFDVIDIHEEPASVAAAEVQLLAWLAGQGQVPFCLYSAQNIAKTYPPPFRWLERIALHRAAAVHSCNDAVTQILRDKGFTGPIENLGLGVDPVEETRRVDPVEDPPTFVIGYVGRLEEHKGVQVLVDAVNRLKDPTIGVEVVGDGPFRHELEGQAENLGITGQVNFVGYVTPDEIRARYSGFDLLVVPSVERPNWIEQFGRVPVEAMSAGIPVIASDSGSLPEVLADAGILVPPENADALAAAICDLRDDPDLREELAKRGRARADHFTWRSIAERHVELYRSMTSA